MVFCVFHKDTSWEFLFLSFFTCVDLVMGWEVICSFVFFNFFVLLMKRRLSNRSPDLTCLITTYLLHNYKKDSQMSNVTVDDDDQSSNLLGLIANCPLFSLLQTSPFHAKETQLTSSFSLGNPLSDLAIEKQKRVTPYSNRTVNTPILPRVSTAPTVGRNQTGIEKASPLEICLVLG